MSWQEDSEKTDHGADRPAGHILDEPREKFLFLEVLIVGLEQLLAGLLELHGDQLESLLLKTRNDLGWKRKRATVRMSRHSVQEGKKN